MIKNVVKKTEYDDLLEKVNINTTDTSNLVKKAEYDTRVVKFKRIADHEHSNKYIIT